MAGTSVKGGLEDVVAGDSAICLVDGKEGRLIYRGYDINDLAVHSSFEETVYLLWHGQLPARQQLAELTAELKANRQLPDEAWQILRSAPAQATPMEALRTTVSALSMSDPGGDDMSREANLRRAVRLTAAFPTIVAGFERLRKGQEPIQPNPDLNHAANFLYLLTGQVPDDLSVKAFDTALVLHADHEFNASTFAARVTAATLSDMYSAVTSAIGALKGPLHGGANERVLRMLQEIGSVDRAAQWVRDALARKARIMGFGHRVYKTMDPRAVHLKRLSRELGERNGDTRWFEISEIIERVMYEEKGLYPNVDFYAASTYHSLGIDREAFTPIFAISRIAGWTAHVLEQYDNNRLIRPVSNYTGSLKETYVPLAERG